MAAFTSKVCVVGDFAVGKTSVAERFVSNHFSEKYLTTVGVKIDTSTVELPQFDVAQKLVIWDVAGTDRFGRTEFAYLRGAAGHVFVADGTRKETLDAAFGLQSQIISLYNRVPSVLLVNKKDLTTRWEVSEGRIEEARETFDSVFVTSARTGDDVKTAFVELARRITLQVLS